MLAAHIACFWVGRVVLLAGKLEAAEASAFLVQDNKPYESVTESSKLYQDREAHTIHGVVQDVKTVHWRTMIGLCNYALKQMKNW